MKSCMQELFGIGAVILVIFGVFGPPEMNDLKAAATGVIEIVEYDVRAVTVR